ncbi:MAG TPA: twin-arginine translocation pathway signal protein [Elusimicrobia bacterium]|nr:twin-arginine translocation pathway signal protein [Elusimicrobiota bacterium]
MRSLLLAVILLPSSFASGTLPARREHRLRMFNTHTHEHIDVVFSRDGVYDPEALAKLDLFLRDHRANKVKHFDPRLFDLLAELTARADRPQAEIHVICGYRTPGSNGLLRGRSKAVAGNSLHMRAEAIDVRLPGVRTARLRDAALGLRRGGVGYYARSDFIHVDVGRVRRW